MRALNTIKFLTDGNIIGVKYSRTKHTLRNWGDALNAYLIPRISGKEIMHYAEYFNTGFKPTLAGIGSILDNNHVKNLYVWGSGLKSDKSPIPVLPKQVFAVRGSLTHKRLTNAGVVCPEVFGDPALVLPHFYKPVNVEKRYKLGIVGHYVDKTAIQAHQIVQHAEVTFIDIESEIENFIDQVYACEVIASSSLHGLIAADAYGVPRALLHVSDDILGGDFKFNDYFSSTDLKIVKAVTLEDSVEKIISAAVQPSRLPEILPLLNTFPFKR